LSLPSENVTPSPFLAKMLTFVIGLILVPMLACDEN